MLTAKAGLIVAGLVGWTVLGVVVTVGVFGWVLMVSGFLLVTTTLSGVFLDID